ncbi:ABC transporter ATP-binding protein [Asaia siamensis]|uniref:ABC transporter ATP-binding protein n=1 Tax=Asaia siamensis TaxID=110479 RepID=A0ABQ1LTX2_9PROT|nr:ABC transporter ATP-binding protein [Asaia siamensis]GBR03134.1 peptide ABC transporter ATP-binding protein [Asaia siamensis NRIC 0323]GGC29880.1 ABC transporter ATP-binding protein [Asaia siamensis]
MTGEALLSVSDLRLQHRQAGILLDGVSLTVKRGQILGVVGESGSGKSLTGLSVLGLQPQGQLSGTLRFDGEDLTRFSSRDWRRFRGRRAAMIFQDPMTAFLPVRRIGPQIVEQIRVHTALSHQAARERVVSLLGRMGVPSPEQTAQRFPHELSGGLRQRAMIAMALSCDPELLIADEPTTALDVTVQTQILTLLKEIGAREASVMLITHDMGVVAQSCTDVAVLYAGVVIETGPVAEVLQAPLHPYTKALLRAIPPMTGSRPERLPVIDGVPPSPDTRPVGCVFAPRCPQVTPDCAIRPPMRGEGAHRAACVLVP